MQCSDDIERNETRPDFIQHGQHQTRALYTGTGPWSMDLPHKVQSLTSKQQKQTVFCMDTRESVTSKSVNAITTRRTSSPPDVHHHHHMYIITTRRTSSPPHVHYHHQTYIITSTCTSSPAHVHHHHHMYIITTTCTSSPAHVHHTYITTTTCTSPPPDVHLPGNCPFPSWICDADLGRRASKNRTDQNYGWHGWRMRLARCLSALNSRLSPIGRGYSWMGDQFGIASC